MYEQLNATTKYLTECNYRICSPKSSMVKKKKERKKEKYT